MKTRLLLLLLALAFFGSLGAGGWWALHRRPDPAQRAAMRAAAGDLRETLFLQRKDVADHQADPAARLRLGQLQLHVFDGAAAEKSFREAERLGADRWAVLLGIADSCTILGDWQKLLDTLPETAPDPAVAARILLLRASAQLALGHDADAAATLDAAQHAAPGRIEPLLIAARIAAARDDAPAAEAAVQAALRLDPADAGALFLEVGLRAARGDLAGATDAAGRAIAAVPWSLVARLNRAQLLLQANEDARARADVDSVLERNPRVSAARFLDAVLIARSGRDADAAVAFERLGVVADLFPRATYIHAVVAAKLGRLASATALAIAYNQRFPTTRDGAALLARLHLEARRPDLAIPVLETATAALPADAPLLEMLGTAYAAAGNTAGSLQVLQRAAAAAPRDERVQAALGLLQLRLGDVTAGLDTLDRSAGPDAATPTASDTLFAAALGAGDLDRAAAALARRRAHDGETATVGTMHALLLLARGDADAARQAFAALVKAFPDAPGPKAALAKMLLAQGQAGEAEALLTGILARDPANMLALDAQMQTWVTEARFEQALQAVSRAEAAAPADPRFVAMHAELLMRSGAARDAVALLAGRRQSKTLDPALLPMLGQAQLAAGAPDLALATYAEILAAAPDNVAVRLRHVGLLLQGNRTDLAQASLREGLARSPGLFSLMSAQVALEGRVNGPAAAASRAAAFRAEPSNMPGAAPLAGDALMAARQPGPAAQAYRAEFEAAPSRLLLLRLANAEVAAGNLDGGAGTLRGWLATHPDDPDALGLLGRIDMRAGRWAAAQAELEARIRRRPADAAALNDLAWVYLAQGDARARDTAKRSFTLAPLPNTADTLGWIMLAQGDVAQAVATLHAALNQAPDSPATAYHLATALDRDGKAAEAVKLLEPLVARPTPFDERPAAEALLRKLQAR